MIFLDTSAVLALADTEDSHHAAAVQTMRRVTAERRTVLTHNYVVVESAAVLQRRLGLASALAFLADSDKLTIHWATAEDHLQAVQLLIRRDRRHLSLVDCMSFTVMRKYGVSTAFAYDEDFRSEGFDTLSGA